MKYCLFIILMLPLELTAQQSFTVTDSLQATYDGLKAGYSITDASEKEVGKKGNFSRYKLKFWVTNTSTEAKIFFQKSGFLLNGVSASNKVVYFKCSNATGARFTNKEATLTMQPCKIEATVEDKECGTDKVLQNRRQVDIGFWIKGGETIAANTIMIVPLDEKPVVTAIFYPGNLGMIGNTASNTNSDNGINTSQGIVRIKNFSSNGYLNNQGGPLVCGNIDFDWWSAQWDLIAVNGSNNFQIKNRWKNNFLSTENNSLLSDNGQSANAMWTLQETSINNVYYIKNVADNNKLIYQNGILKTASFSPEANAQWIVERL